MCKTESSFMFSFEQSDGLSLAEVRMEVMCSFNT